MIRSFADRDTETLFRTEQSRRFDAIPRFASSMTSLFPPVIGWKPLQDSLSGFHSIRINDQWPIVFRWTDSGPEQVSIVRRFQISSGTPTVVTSFRARARHARALKQ